jgi:hypothetical protein
MRDPPKALPSKVVRAAAGINWHLGDIGGIC